MIIYEESTAVISDDQKYRYLLRRVWDFTRIRALFVMLNPSTASAYDDDPTIRSCVRLCKENNFGGLEVVNLFGLRATDPKELSEADDPIGPDNGRFIEAAILRCDLVVCAWGAHKEAVSRGRAILSFIRDHRPAAFCFGVTKDRQPKHPLYIKSSTPLIVYG